jgi:hypothetical protein
MKKLEHTKCYNFACGSDGCETWSLIFREEHRLRIFENRVRRKILFGPRRDDVTGGCRKLLNEEFHNLYTSPSIIIMMKSRMRWAEHVARIGRGGKGGEECI